MEITKNELTFLCCPKCHAEPIAQNVMQVRGQYFCKCDICGFEWQSSGINAVNPRVEGILSTKNEWHEKNDRINTKAVFGLISLIIFVVGAIAGIGPMWAGGLCGFLMGSALMNFE